MRSSRSSGTIASSVATTRELSQRSEQLRVLLVHRTNIPPQFFALDSILSTARLHIAVPLLSQSAPKPPFRLAPSRAGAASRDLWPGAAPCAPLCSMTPRCLCRDSRTAPRW